MSEVSDEEQKLGYLILFCSDTLAPVPIAGAISGHRYGKGCWNSSYGQNKDVPMEKIAKTLRID